MPPARASAARDAPFDARQRRLELGRRLADVIGDALAAGTPISDVTVEHLIQQAGIARSTFYAYFDDKGALLADCYAEVVGEVEAAARAWWLLAEPPTRAELEAIIAGIATACRRHGALLAAAHGSVASEPAVAAVVETMRERAVTALGAHITHGQARGWIAAAYPARETARWLVLMAQGGLAQEGFGPAGPRGARATRAFTAIVWTTLYAQPVRSARAPLSSPR